MRLIAVIVGLCLLSCGGINHADFSKRKYLDLRKFSDKKENNNAAQNSFTTKSDGMLFTDTLQLKNVEQQVEASIFIAEVLETENETQLIEAAVDQPMFEFPDTNKTDIQTEEVVEDPDVVSHNPDLDVFNRRAKLSFWLILAGLAAAILSVAIVLEGSAVLYIIVVAIAAACLLTGFILSIKNAALAKKIPEEDKTGLFQLKKFFAWLVSVTGVLILGGLLGYLIFELFW